MANRTFILTSAALGVLSLAFIGTLIAPDDASPRTATTASATGDLPEKNSFECTRRLNYISSEGQFFSAEGARLKLLNTSVTTDPYQILNEYEAALHTFGVVLDRIKDARREVVSIAGKCITEQSAALFQVSTDSLFSDLQLDYKKKQTEAARMRLALFAN